MSNVLPTCTLPSGVIRFFLKQGKQPPWRVCASKLIGIAQDILYFPAHLFIKCLKKLARKDGVENWEMGEDEDDTAQSPPYLTNDHSGHTW